MSSPARIFGTFLSPGRTFADLAREPHFILCWCVQAAAGMGYGAMLLHRVGRYGLAQQAVMQSSRTTALGPAAVQTATANAAKFFPISLYAAPVFTIISLLFLGWIFQGISTFLLGIEVRYKQTLAMVSHAFLVWTVYTLLAMLTLGLMRDPTTFQFTNPLGTNLSFYLNKGSSPAFLYALGSHLDVFAVWALVLLSLGLAKLGGRKGKFGSALAATATLWLFYCLVVAGVAAAFA
ncbi:MAG TPA: YIP1 family protein [Terriglobales bacterium]|nr:YIP1 family protein [Terriglobales bacterium]